MALFATVEDVLARWDGPAPLDQLEYIDTKLSDAEVEVQALVGDIMSRIVAGKTTTAAVKIVLCRMVIRVLRNVDGVKTQTVGPFSYTLDQQVASGRLFISREDRRLLGMGGSASTLSLSDADASLEHVPKRPGCEPLPVPSWPTSESSTC